MRGRDGHGIEEEDSPGDVGAGNKWWVEEIRVSDIIM